MSKKCPRCGAQFPANALQMIETVAAAGLPNVTFTCGNCQASLTMKEIQAYRPKKVAKTVSSATNADAEKRWWQFWK